MRRCSASSVTTHPTYIAPSRSTAGSFLCSSLSCHFSCSRVRNERISAALYASGSTFTTLCDPAARTPVPRRRLVVACTDGPSNGPLRNLAALAAFCLVRVRVLAATRARICRARPAVRTVRDAHAMGLSPAAARLLVLLRESRAPTTTADGRLLLRRHRGSALGARRDLASLFARRDLGAMGFALRCRGTAPLSLLAIDPLVSRAVRRRCHLRRIVSAVAPPTALARKLPRSGALRRVLGQSATPGCLKRSKTLAGALSRGVRGHPTTVRLHAPHELRPVHLGSSHASVLHEATSSPDTCGTRKASRGLAR